MAGVSLAVRTFSARASQHAPVVLLPATGCTAHDWDAIADVLSRDRDVHAVDLRGHGRSDWTAHYSIDLMAADFAALLPMLAPQLDVVGHSLGGLVAVRALGLEPRIARRLVLEDVGVPHPRRPTMPERPDGDLDFDWAVIEQVRPEIDAPAGHWRDTLSSIGVPTLVIGGGSTSFVPQAHVAELAALVPDAHHITIDAGHYIHASQPEQFVQAVRRFIDGHASGAVR